jgi:hypothetical protein
MAASVCREKNMVMTRSYLGFIVLTVVLASCVCPATAAFKHNETIWTSSGNQFVGELYLSGLATTPMHHQYGYEFTILPSGTAGLITPFGNSIIKDGTRPRVRFITFALNMPVGVKVAGVYIYNGPDPVVSRTVNWAGTGAVKDYPLDMSSYYLMNRGVTAMLIIQNTEPSAHLVSTYGGGVKQEWN